MFQSRRHCSDPTFQPKGLVDPTGAHVLALGLVLITCIGGAG